MLKIWAVALCLFTLVLHGMPYAWMVFIPLMLFWFFVCFCIGIVVDFFVGEKVDRWFSGEY